MRPGLARSSVHRSALCVDLKVFRSCHLRLCFVALVALVALVAFVSVVAHKLKGTICPAFTKQCSYAKIPIKARMPAKANNT